MILLYTCLAKQNNFLFLLRLKVRESNKVNSDEKKKQKNYGYK